MPKSRKNILEKLKTGVSDERDVVREKLASLESKVAAAEKIFPSDDDDVERNVASRVKKVKRDTFTFPEEDHLIIGDLVERMLKISIKTNKSEIVRAGLSVLSSQDDREISRVLAGLDKKKVGRPKLQ